MQKLNAQVERGVARIIAKALSVASFVFLCGKSVFSTVEAMQNGCAPVRFG